MSKSLPPSKTNISDLSIQDKHFGCLLTQDTCGDFSNLISVRSVYDAVISQHVLCYKSWLLAGHYCYLSFEYSWFI